jgi:dihydrofolate synthase/folylpolyglutamate synthase
MVQDKDHAGFLKALLPRVRHVVFTQAACDRALPAGELKDRVPRAVRTPTSSVAPGVAEALSAALSAARNDELVCVTGSFYTVGEAMQCLGIGVRETV